MCFFLLLYTSFWFSTAQGQTPVISDLSCSQLYASSRVYTSSDALKSKTCRIGLGVLGLSCSVVATIMSAGLSSPVTIPLGVTSAAISAGDASITGFNSQYIFSQWKNEKDIKFNSCF